MHTTHARAGPELLPQITDIDTGPSDFLVLVKTFELEARNRVSPIAPPNPRDVVLKLRAGKPLVSWENLSLDWAWLQQWFKRLLVALPRCFPLDEKTIKHCEPLTGNQEQFRDTVRACYTCRALPRAVARGTNERDILRLVIQTLLRPIMNIQQKALQPVVDQELWRRGACPVCGGLPDMALLDRGQGERWLVCSRCDGRWRFQRTECPYCSCVDQSRLSYFTDKKGEFRLYVCEECHSYLKAVDLRNYHGRTSLNGLREQTRELGWQANQKGYRSPTTLYLQDIYQLLKV